MPLARHLGVALTRFGQREQTPAMTHEQSQPESGGARLEPPDPSEKGGLKGGQPQRSDERLFMQLLAFTGCTDAAAAAAHLAAARWRASSTRI